MRAAVPNYVGTDFSKAPPGHRFRLYFEIWKDKGWDIESNGKKDAVGRVLDMGPAVELVHALARRAAETGAAAHHLDALSTAPFVTGMGMEHPLENGFAFLDPYGVPYLPGSSVKGVVRRAAEELALFEEDAKGWTLPAIWWLFGFDAKSGFFSGGGKDDPEPVRTERARWRRAYETAKRSADFSPHVDDPAPMLLQAFHKLVDPNGKIAGSPLDFLHKLQENPPARNSVHTRGSLAFWDVIPLPGEGDAANLRVDIMNPHYSHYYQKGEPPHDAGSPKPIFYLTVPAGWSFTFRVQLLPTGALPPWFTETSDDGRPRWQALLEAAFEHAFTWLGFGAKTSLGYGGMRVDESARQREEEERKKREAEMERKRAEEEAKRRQEEAQRRREALTPLQRALEDLEDADHDGFIEVFGRLDGFEGEEQETLAAALKSWMQEHGEWKLKKRKGKKWERVVRIKEILGEGS